MFWADGGCKSINELGFQKKDVGNKGDENDDEYKSD